MWNLSQHSHASDVNAHQDDAFDESFDDDELPNYEDDSPYFY